MNIPWKKIGTGFLKVGVWCVGHKDEAVAIINIVKK